MADYRRNFVPGGTFFFTVVVHERRPILTTDLARSCLRSTIREEKESRPFDLVALVLLPDHLHAVWSLPRGDSDFSTRWAKIKANFTRRYLRAGGNEGDRSPSRIRQQERAIWQRRFWEHTCRDEQDLRRCVDYLHWNPVKHGLVEKVGDYPWSSFHRFVREGEYESEWNAVPAFPSAIGVDWE